MNFRTAIPFLILIVFSSCGNSQNIGFQTIVINPDSCKIWQLPEVNFTVQVPSDYDITYNSSGGFYFQGHKRNNEKLICEISFGRIDGEIETSEFVNVLAQTDTEFRNQIKQINQIYKTRFVGIDSIGYLLIPQLRNYIEFQDFDPNIDGKYNGLTLPIILDNGTKFMFSSMLQIDQEFNDKLIGFEIIKIIKSIKTVGK
jgi:hypothetical protein